MPPTPSKTPAEPDTLGARLDDLDEKISALADKVDAFSNIQLPSPEAIDALTVRIDALEDRDETVDYGQRAADGDDRPPAPAARLCPECGGPEGGPHFDDCEIGNGSDAMPKSQAQREALQRRRDRGDA